MDSCDLIVGNRNSYAPYSNKAYNSIRSEHRYAIVEQLGNSHKSVTWEDGKLNCPSSITPLVFCREQREKCVDAFLLKSPRNCLLVPRSGLDGKPFVCHGYRR